MYDKYEMIFCKYVDGLSHLYSNSQIDFQFANSKFNFGYPDDIYSYLLTEELNQQLLTLIDGSVSKEDFIKRLNPLIILLWEHVIFILNMIK